MFVNATAKREDTCRMKNKCSIGLFLTFTIGLLLCPTSLAYSIGQSSSTCHPSHDCCDSSKPASNNADADENAYCTLHCQPAAENLASQTPTLQPVLSIAIVSPQVSPASSCPTYIVERATPNQYLEISKTHPHNGPPSQA